jgi:ectoine hydroxylase-related dioxygenase (phytanoyl-CoA dioxygenase family)
MTTTPAIEDLLPTDDEVAAYQRDGFYVSRRIVPDDLLDAAEHGMRRFYAGDLDAPFPGRTRYDHFDWTPEHGNVLRKNDYTSLMVRELAALVRSPAIGAVAARLAAAAEIRLWHDQLLYKPPGLDGAAGNVGWHTDRQYWGTCTSEDMLTAWVPFHDCDESVGGVAFVEGSHTWLQESGLDFFDGDLAAQERRFAAGDEPVVKTTPVLPRGSVTFHHCRTVHGSGPNRSGAPRRSMAIHLQPTDNRHRPIGDDGQPTYHRNDELVRRVDGLPDYTDPRICPVLT